MEKLSSCNLISFDPDAHEAGAAASETQRTVKVTEKAVGMNEAYQAMGLGLNPEKRLLIPYEKDYRGERELIYEGERWKVLRVAWNEFNGVLLTIQRMSGNAVPAPEPDEVEDEPQEAGGGDNDAG